MRSGSELENYWSSGIRPCLPTIATDHWFMEPPERPRPHWTEAPRGDDQRQEAPVDLPTIALDEEEASRLLKALERPCDRSVARLEDLRRRS